MHDENSQDLQKQIDALKQTVAQLKQQVDEMDPTCSFEGMSQEELRQMILHLRPDREMYVGKDFLLGILNSRGVSGLEQTSNKLLKALSSEGGLDIPHDFDVVEKEVFRKTSLRLWNRKEFLTSMAWTIPGVVLLGKTPLDLIAAGIEQSYRRKVEAAKDAHEKLGQEEGGNAPQPQEQHDTALPPPASPAAPPQQAVEHMTPDDARLAHIKELKAFAERADEEMWREHAQFWKIYRMVQTVSLVSDVPLAAALVYEGISHDREMRLEHIADAVSELAERIKAEQKQQKGAGR